MRALLLLLLLAAPAWASEARFTGTLLGGYALRSWFEEPSPNETRVGGGAVAGTALYQWGSGVGFGLALGYQAYGIEHYEVTRAPCDFCDYARTRESTRFGALELGLVLRWARPEGRLRPSGQFGLGYARSSVTDPYRSGVPGVDAHLGVGLEWWVLPEFALRAELRESAALFLSYENGHFALWTSALLGVAF